MTKCCGQEGYENGRPQHDRRLQLIGDIKQLIGDMDNEERGRTRGGGQKRGGVSIPGVRDMEEECLQYRKRRDCSPPTITSIGTHEIRPTSMYDTMKYESSKRLTYVDATRDGADPWDPMPPAPWELPRTPSQELRAGTLYMSCDCRKRNGLQHDCQRWDCGGRPTCLAVNPGPCCTPSKARKPVRGDRRHQGGAQTQGFTEPQMTQSNVPPNSPAEDSSPRAKGPTTGDKDSSMMVCLCAPVGGSKTPAPAPAPAPVAAQAPRREIVGVIAFSSSPPGQRVEGLPSPQGGTSSAPAPAHSQPPPTGEFVATSPTGQKFLCCPIPS